MEIVKSTKTVKKKNSSGPFLTLLVLIAVLPLYGLYFQASQQMINSTDSMDFNQNFEAATSLSQIGLLQESNQALWSLLHKASGVQHKLMVLELIRRNASKSNQLEQLLHSLYLIQAFDPDERESRYKTELFDTLKKMGKDKDASLYLQAKSGLVKRSVNSGSAQEVVASVRQEEVYRSELDEFMVDNPNFKGKSSEALAQLIIRRVLKKKSLPLLEDQVFQKQLENLSVDMRVSEFLKRELKTQEPTALELTAYYEIKKAQYNHAAGARVAHLMLNSTDDQILKKLQEQPPQTLDQFKSMTRQHSRSLNKIRGGSIPDWVESDELPTEGTFEGLWEYLKNQSVGFNGPFTSRRGLHFFWIEDKREAASKSFEEVKDDLLIQYRTERSKQIQENYFKELINAEQVQIFYERI